MPMPQHPTDAPNGVQGTFPELALPRATVEVRGGFINCMDSEPPKPQLTAEEQAKIEHAIKRLLAVPRERMSPVKFGQRLEKQAYRIGDRLRSEFIRQAMHAVARVEQSRKSR